MTTANLTARRAISDADYPRRKSPWRFLVPWMLAIGLGAYCLIGCTQPPSDFDRENRIRGDYAGIVNDCYSKNRTGSADAMYSCIESHD